ncbi:MAG: FG-GAP-like repeat-containing protein [Planctomycetota bacterium]
MLSSASEGQMSFSDHTSDAGVDVSHETSIWFTLSSLNVASMIGGAAVGDFDRDGFQDLYFVSGGTVPDRLFMNNGDGTFTEEAAARGIVGLHLGMGVAVGDIDGDGWLDLFVTSLGPAVAPAVPGANILYRNIGNGVFEDVAAAAGVAEIATNFADGFGSAFGDYDLDGDLDLFVAGWVPPSNGNQLMRNNGDGTFTQVTASVDMDLEGTRGFSPMFADMNGDRYPELLLAADFGTSRYFINNGDGTFTDATGLPSGTGLDGNGMGHVVADFDGDGLPDWYVTSIFSEDSSLPAVPGTGNMLYMNTGDHQYDERSTRLGVNDGGWGWGTVAFDADHDGRVDLFETNGWSQPNNGEPEWVDEACYVWRNTDPDGFNDVTDACGIVHNDMGRGMLAVDIDNDADLDLVICSADGPLLLFRNDHDPANGLGLRVLLDTSTRPDLPPDGYGAHVVATIDGIAQHRWLTGGAHYLSQSELSAHFGLAGAATVDTLSVTWTDGETTLLTDVAGGQTLTISPSSPVFGDVTHDGRVNVEDIVAVLLAWGTADADADVDGSGTVDVGDLVLVLLAWS